jgi:hypothetical protein
MGVIAGCAVLSHFSLSKSSHPVRQIQTNLLYGHYRPIFALRMMAILNAALTADDKAPLISFKAGEPDWKLSSMIELERMPAVQFELTNIRKFKVANPAKHATALAALREIVSR